MESHDFKKFLLSFRIEICMINLSSLRQLLKANRIIRNVYFISSGDKQTELTDIVGERIIYIIRKIEENEQIILETKEQLQELEKKLTH